MKKTLTLRQRGAGVIDCTPATNVKPVSSHIIAARSKLCKVLFLALSVTFLFFVCESNISGMAKQRKTCLVPRSDKFECQDRRSKVKVTGDKKRAVHSHHPQQRWNGPLLHDTL